MRGLLLAASLAVAGPAATAPTVVIYRCVAADGAVTIQNDAKCPKGTREQKRVVAVPAPRPVEAPVAAMPASTPLAPAPAVQADATPTAASTDTATASPAASGAPPAPMPAPPIDVCLTSDAQRYYADPGHGTRCAPVAVVGLDGSADTASTAACEVVQDRCEPVPEADRCAAWAERRRAAERAQLFEPERATEAREDLARVDAATSGTVCGR